MLKNCLLALAAEKCSVFAVHIHFLGACPSANTQDHPLGAVVDNQIVLKNQRTLHGAGCTLRYVLGMFFGKRDGAVAVRKVHFLLNRRGEIINCRISVARCYGKSLSHSTG